MSNFGGTVTTHQPNLTHTEATKFPAETEFKSYLLILQNQSLLVLQSSL